MGWILVHELVPYELLQYRFGFMSYIPYMSAVPFVHLLDSNSNIYEEQLIRYTHFFYKK